jgi:hypothetical protein
LKEHVVSTIWMCVHAAFGHSVEAAKVVVAQVSILQLLDCSVGAAWRQANMQRLSFLYEYCHCQPPCRAAQNATALLTLLYSYTLTCALLAGGGKRQDHEDQRRVRPGRACVPAAVHEGARHPKRRAGGQVWLDGACLSAGRAQANTCTPRQRVATSVSPTCAPCGGGRWHVYRIFF